MAGNCYATSDSSGEPICGIHNEPLIPQNRKSQMPGSAPSTWLVCPVTGQTINYVP